MDRGRAKKSIAAQAASDGVKVEKKVEKKPTVGAKRPASSDGKPALPKKTKDEPTQVLHKSERIIVERSRSQVKAWTGIKGKGQYHVIKYSDESEIEGLKKKCEKWLFGKKSAT